MPVTKPVLSTVATPGLEEVHGETAAGVPEPVSCDVVPLQNVSPPLIVGFGLTTMVRLTLLAHCPAVGVKV